eukprot:1161439-Pelagomonas_calceolata.AAC.13
MEAEYCSGSKGHEQDSERREEERKGKERKGKERKGRERREREGKEGKGKERRGEERKRLSFVAMMGGNFAMGRKGQETNASKQERELCNLSALGRQHSHVQDQ